MQLLVIGMDVRFQIEGTSEVREGRVVSISADKTEFVVEAKLPTRRITAEQFLCRFEADCTIVGRLQQPSDASEKDIPQGFKTNKSLLNQAGLGPPKEGK